MDLTYDISLLNKIPGKKDYLNYNFTRALDSLGFDHKTFSAHSSNNKILDSLWHSYNRLSETVEKYNKITHLKLK